MVGRAFVVGRVFCVPGSLAGMSRLPDARGRALMALCVTEITSWGTLYYAFPVLLGPITKRAFTEHATAGITGSVDSAFRLARARHLLLATAKRRRPMALLAPLARSDDRRRPLGPGKRVQR